MGPNPIWLLSLKEEIRIQRENLCEDTGRRWPSTSLRERPQKKPTLLTPWSWTSSPRIVKKINFCCSSHPAYGTLLWQPQQTNIEKTSCLVGHNLYHSLLPCTCPLYSFILPLFLLMVFEFVLLKGYLQKVKKVATCTGWCGSVGWSAVLLTERFQVLFLVRKHAWSENMPVSGHIREGTNQCFSLISVLSLSSPHPLSLKSISMSLGEDKKVK